MRLLHTSDWHLGRTVKQRWSRDDDFDAVLAEITAIARDARPDLIIHSGDLFDSGRPVASDLARCLHALSDLSEVAPVVVVAGNHDSPVLLEALEFVVTAFGAKAGPGVPKVKFIARARRPGDGGIVDYPARGTDQRIRVAALPFIHQNRFLDDFTSPATGTRDYARRLRGIQDELQRGLLDGYQPDRDVLVFAAHLYVEGALPSYTERPVEISETYLTQADALPTVSYAALGHIHRPQAIPRGGLVARYAGSPLQLDFGEAGEDKSVVVVDADPGRPVRIELMPLRAGRPLADFTGTLGELRAQATQIGNAFVRAVIVSEQPIPNLAAAAKDAAPQATFVSIDPRCAASQVAVLERSETDGEEPDLPDLFREYLQGRVPAGGDAGDILATFTAMLADTASEAPGTFREEAQLRAVLQEESGAQALGGGLLIPTQSAPETSTAQAEGTRA